MTPKDRTFTRDDVEIATRIRGDGHTVLLVASVGRSGDDFHLLAERLASSGFCAVSVDLRGIGGSTGPLDDITMHDLTSDLAMIVDGLARGPAHVIGHAFGQRVSRCFAVDHPGRVARVVALACGGSVEPAPEAYLALGRCFDTELSREEHLEAVRFAFFADGNDAAVWEGGWWPDAARAHAAAAAQVPREHWWMCGDKDVLVIQGRQDRVAPLENGRSLRDADPQRIQLVEIDDCGHAMLPEQPDAIAEHVIAFLRAG